MTVTINKRDVAKAARARYDAGTLSAQAPVPVCEYRSEQGGVTYACAIGAALSDKQLAELAAAGDFLNSDDFQCRGLTALKGWEADDRTAVLRLQERHDQWASDRDGRPTALAEESEKDFLRLVDSILAENP